MPESDQHAPRVDKQLKHETEYLEDGSPTENRDEGRRQQAPADDEPDLNAGDRPELDEAPGTGLSEQDVERRSELARHLRGCAFPSGREGLIATATETHAPGYLLDQLRRLPEQSYDNVQAVWQALGGRVEGHSSPDR